VRAIEPPGQPPLISPAAPVERSRHLALSPVEWAALTVTGLAIALRFVEFWKLPGINGDEAWYGVQALNLASGAQVDWRTPTGNLVGPAQLSSLLLLHLLVDPSAWVLRAPALVAGIVEVAAVGYFTGRALGRRAGFTAAVLCAALPVNMAYSRFGWDPSHLGLWSALAVGAALRGRLGWMGLAFAMGLWVHPTHVFIAPFIGMTFAAVHLQRPESVLRRAGWMAAALTVLAACSFALRFTTQASSAMPKGSAVLERLTSGQAWVTHLARLARFFLGDTTYEYLTGAGYPGAPGLWVAGFWLAVLLLVGVGAVGMARSRSLLGAGVLLGAALMHLLFFAVAGPVNLKPHLERFGLVLVVPSIIAALACAVAVPWPRAGLKAAPAIAAVVLSALLVAGFGRYFLVELHRTGSTSHQTFWTGPVEPKVLAVRRILNARRPGVPLVIVADGWWTIWLARYLTYRQPDVSVTSLFGEVDLRSTEVDAVILGLPGEGAEEWIASSDEGRQFVRQNIPGYSRSAAVSIWLRR
jgi:hypothetical protein